MGGFQRSRRARCRWGELSSASSGVEGDGALQAGGWRQGFTVIWGRGWEVSKAQREGAFQHAVGGRKDGGGKRKGETGFPTLKGVPIEMTGFATFWG